MTPAVGVVLLDTSAWVEYLRATGSPVCVEVRRLLREDQVAVVTTPPVVMELLAGPTDPRVVEQVERLVDGLVGLPLDVDLDFRAAAAAARASRARGETVRSVVDCLIAAVAARTGVPILHQDRDFLLLAAVLPDLHLHLR